MDTRGHLGPCHRANRESRGGTTAVLREPSLLSRSYWPPSGKDREELQFKATLLTNDLQAPDVYVTYPICKYHQLWHSIELFFDSRNLIAVDVSLEARSNHANITRLMYHPEFGGYNDQLYQQSLKYTVLSGLSATGM